MAFKLIESAQSRWRPVNAPHGVPLVWAGAAFSKGRLVERPTKKAVRRKSCEDAYLNCLLLQIGG